jgi:CMP-N-acetylneuraminic acid synthetase
MKDHIPMQIAMIPARMGSQRLKHKNLRELDGVALIIRAIRKCINTGIFDQIWVNSEHPTFGDIAAKEGVFFHQRPEELGNDNATSEQYINDFLKAHKCQRIFQIHSVAPLLTVTEIQDFVRFMITHDFDCLLSTEKIQIECIFKGDPINFSFQEKTNSQDIVPINRLPWSITGWRRSTYLKAISDGLCATFAGKIGFMSVSRFAAHVIKTEEDLRIAEALLPLVPGA